MLSKLRDPVSFTSTRALSLFNEDRMVHFQSHRPFPYQVYVVIECFRFSEFQMGLYTLPAKKANKRLPLLARADFLMRYILDQPTASSSFNPFCVFTHSGDEFVEILFVRRIV